METIKIKNLEKYQPTYKDNRRLIWIRWYIDSLSDYRFTKLTPQQKWLFIGLTMIEVKEQGHIPLDHDWICHQLQYDKKHISKDLNTLKELGLFVTNCDDLSQDVTKCDVDKIREDKKRKENREQKQNERFELLWKDYRKKAGKPKALEYFVSSIKTDQDWCDIQAALKNYNQMLDEEDYRSPKDGQGWFNPKEWRGWVDYKPDPKVKKQQPKPRDSINYDELIEKKLGNIATKEMIKALMLDIPVNLHWKIDKFLNKRYPEGGSGFIEAEREIEKEVRDNKEKLQELIGKV